VILKDMRILLIDDDPLLLEALPPALTRRLPHSDITTALSPQDGLHYLEHERFDVVITDLLMSGMPGDELTSRIRTLAHRVPVILITGVPEFPGEVLPAHVFAVVRKPFDITVLVQTIIAASESLHSA
jgi:DNA-binding NtrC family response regulator